jgi:hypothetical protein
MDNGIIFDIYLQVILFYMDITCDSISGGMWNIT